ncbi:MsnO8 family LLM class oxidoreductase [Oceanitalea stevensii]|uniref:MsnO8 family LLM class oxidoreductase n=1 Tax=Oceanitalea stevensii TaxID=2763072 RepID=UPI002044E18C|nr:MsnO8 family LLM class oxidoreductase [Oceanitalea stevensii]
MTRLRLSLLDRSRTRAGEEHAAALRATVGRAQRAEELGYHRFWVAEHHAVPGIASGAPAVLAAAVAAATSRIRVGSGGVMLPNHRPIVVAEQFAVLEALHPGRIDLGVGRSLGFTAPVREALGTTRYAPEAFAADLAALRDFLTGHGPVTAMPVVTDPPPVLVLATGSGLEVAARAGLPVVVGGPALSADDGAIARYRREFRPTEACPEPYVVISLEVMVARTTTHARDLLLPEAWAMAESRTTGAFPPLEPVEAVRRRQPTDKQRATIAGFLSSALYGTPTAVGVSLAALAERTGADEVMVSTSTYDREELAHADAALTEAVNAA